MKNIYYTRGDMKNIDYNLPSFYKAIKRNNVDYVNYCDRDKSFWFFTRKAVINCYAFSDKAVEVVKTWLVNNGIEVR